MPTLPELVIRILSNGVDDPSEVVENSKRPGISLAPGVPSTPEEILAATIWSAPSYPVKTKLPKLSFA
jgi:hypothetical protein